MVNLNEILARAVKEKFAVGAFNVYDAESVQAVIETAEEERSPALMITGPLEIPLLGLRTFVAVTRAAVEEAKVPVCLHLDHYTDPDFVEQAIEAGFPSVMLDSSNLSFEDNVAVTRRIVGKARGYGVTVEGELGRIGKVDLSAESGGDSAEATDPERAVEYVERTGIDALAANIGNAHGMYRTAPRLRFDILERIASLVQVPLVLHGGSGTPEPDLKRCIALGVRKVNVATELHVAFSGIVGGDIRKGNGFTWVSTSLIRVKEEQKNVIRRWMRVLGSSGKA